LSQLLDAALDIDKLDYVARDVDACHVPHARLDVTGLLPSLRVIASPQGQRCLALAQERRGALVSFLHARQTMYLRATEFSRIAEKDRQGAIGALRVVLHKSAAFAWQRFSPP